MLLQALVEVAKDNESSDNAVDDKHDLTLLHQTLGEEVSEDLIERQQ
jgi:hypothetical protein